MKTLSSKQLGLLAVGLATVLAVSGLAAYYASISQYHPAKTVIRVACVGDSLTQSTEYPYDLWMLLGNESYSLHNFGAGSTMITLQSETPYMNTTACNDALHFKPNIVIIMLGTNDAQPSVERYNATFVQDYVALIEGFQELSSKPQIWLMLPPPIFSNQSGKIDPEYFKATVIPGIEQAANTTNLPIIDVYSVFAGHSDYVPDGVHINSEGAKLIASVVYEALTSGDELG